MTSFTFMLAEVPALYGVDDEVAPVLAVQDLIAGSDDRIRFSRIQEPVRLIHDGRGLLDEDDVLHKGKADLGARDLEIFLGAKRLDAVVGSAVDGKLPDGIALLPEFLFHNFSLRVA